MKKAIILFAAALFCFAGTDVSAQKQNGDEMNLEVQFAPLGGNPIGLNGIRFRKFLSENSAVRVNFFLGGTTNSSPTREAGTESFLPNGDVVSNSNRLSDIARTFDFTIRPGYEIHFDGTDRLSPYVGFELDFGTGSVSDESELFSATGQSTDSGVNVQDFVEWSRTEKQSYTRLGFNLVAGFDFYFADNLYLGAELGYGFARTAWNDVEYSWNNDNAYFMAVSGGASINSTQGDDTGFYLPGGDGNFQDTPQMGGSNSAFGPTVNGRIRLGFLFN